MVCTSKIFCILFPDFALPVNTLITFALMLTTLERGTVAEPTLNERFRGNPPKRGPEDSHAWLGAEEQRFILWGLRESWSAARIGRALGVNEVTARRFRNKIWAQPDLLLELGLFEMVGRATNEEYRCLVCGERVIKRPAVESHVKRHYVNDAHECIEG